MTDRLADECHGYDLDGYPIADLSDCPPVIAAKLARCNEIARDQLQKTREDSRRARLYAAETGLDRSILARLEPRRLSAADDYIRNLNA